MFDYFSKKIEMLLDAVLAAVWQWVMAARAPADPDEKFT